MDQRNEAREGELVKWLLDLQPTGLFQIANAVGRVLFDGAFRSELPWALKERTARQIAEVPAMIAALREAQGALEAVWHEDATTYSATVESAMRHVQDVMNAVPIDE